MGNYYIKKVVPSDLSETQKKEIISLHQKFFDLKGDEIIDFLKNRTYIDMYYLKKNNQLVGTIGIQWYDVNGVVINYLGNAVIDKELQGQGVLTKSIMSSVLRSYWRYPFKEKYYVSFATTPKAYSYFTKFPLAWPKPYEPMADRVKAVFREFLNMCYPNQFQESTEGFVILPETSNLKSTPVELNAQARFEHAWFTLANHNYHQGEQLVCAVKMCPKNFVVLTKTSLMNLLKPIGNWWTRSIKFLKNHKDGVYISIISTLGVAYMLSD